MVNFSDTAEGIIARLDERLSARGEDCILRRTVKRSGSAVDVDVTVRAVVRAVSAEKVVGTITQTDLEIILSPTQITAANWPGTDDNVLAGTTINQSIPKVTDKVIVQGRERQVKQAKPILVGGALVRIELMVAG